MSNEFNRLYGSGGAVGGVLAGTLPNPDFALDMATQAELDAAQTLNPRASVAVDLVTRYGVQGNAAIRATRATVTSGSNILEDLTSTFAAGDVGKGVIILDAGAASGSGHYALGATISGFTDTHHVTLDRNAQSSVTLGDYYLQSRAVDNQALIQAALAALPSNNHVGAVAFAPNGQDYTIERPIVMQRGQQIIGSGASGIGDIRAGAGFPRCLVAGGGFTTAAAVTSTFTVTVDAVPAWMQLPQADIPSGTGVACAGGVVFTYTGTTATTFTGCRSYSLSATVAAGTPLSTFMVWMLDPASPFGPRTMALEYIGVQAGTLPGVAGIYAPHLLETCRIRGVAVSNFENRGILAAPPPNNTTNRPRGYVLEDVAFNLDVSANPGTICLDERASAAGGVTNRIGHRGVTITAAGAMQALVGVRLNGVTAGDYGPYHIEGVVDGILIGDQLTTGPITVRAHCGNVAGTTNLVHISTGAAGHIVRLEDLYLDNHASFASRRVVKDDQSSNTPTEFAVGLYEVGADGLVTTDAASATNNLRSGGGGGGGIITAHKASDSAGFVNSTALHDDLELALSVAANSVYRIAFKGLFEAANGTMDIKVGWSAPAGAAFTWGTDGTGANNVAGFGPVTTATTPNVMKAITDTLVCGSAAGVVGVTLHGILITGGTAGTLQFRWAQSTSDAGTLALDAGSYLEAVKIA